MKHKIGILLINLGTPSNPSKKAVRRYLKEFLSDPRVIDLPSWLRYILLYGFILPFRPKQSAKAYAAIWDKEKGSPLLFHTTELGKELGVFLGEDYQVEIAMRYGEPQLSMQLDKMLANGCQEIRVLPLFPQYSSAATGSAIESFLTNIKNKNIIPNIFIRQAFYNDSGYIQAQAAVIAPFFKQKAYDMLIFSYHSLPVRHIHKGKTNCPPACFENVPCPIIEGNKVNCYRAQCYETSRLLALELGLQEKEYRVVFQSRLGRTPWIGPDLLSTLCELREQKVNSILVASPSFVADCLETLEEIGIRAREKWEKGGGHFMLVPCLNNHPLWVKALAELVI